MDRSEGEVRGQGRITLPFGTGQRLATAIVLLLLGMALTFGFLMESLRSDQYTLSFVRDQLPVSDTEIIQNHQRLVWDIRILVVLGLAAAVLWLVWQYRATANIKALVPEVPLGPAVAVAGWFVPGANVVLPALAMRELWRAGNPNVEDWRRSWTSPLVWVWWLLVLAAVALAAFALVPALSAHPTGDDLFLRDQRGVPAAGLGLLASLAAAILIWVLQGRLALKEDIALLGGWEGWSERRRGRRGAES